MALLASPWLGRRFSRWLGRVAVRRPGAFIERPKAWTVDDAAIFFDQFREPARGRAAQLTYRTVRTRELPAIMAGRFDGERLTTPTLFLHGIEDPVLRPDTVRACERHADELDFELVEGAGHFVAEDAAELVTERMLEFFAREARSGPRAEETAEADAGVGR
jgi:pimeloyl-ACP methyl ester carboxylesterase